MQGDSVPLAGSAGTGKTTLALQYLVNGTMQFGENGVCVTFEQLPDQIITGSPRKTMTKEAVRAWGEAFGAKR